MENNVLWTDRKRIAFGLPWTFTKYTLTDACLFMQSGVFNTAQEEIRLYRILDITLKRSFWERLFGLGTIHLCTADKSTPEVNILHIKKPNEIRTLISNQVEAVRSERLVSVREYMGDEDEAGDLH